MNGLAEEIWRLAVDIERLEKSQAIEGAEARALRAVFQNSINQFQGESGRKALKPARNRSQELTRALNILNGTPGVDL